MIFINFSRSKSIFRATLTVAVLGLAIGFIVMQKRRPEPPPGCRVIADRLAQCPDGIYHWTERWMASGHPEVKKAIPIAICNAPMGHVCNASGLCNANGVDIKCPDHQDEPTFTIQASSGAGDGSGAHSHPTLDEIDCMTPLEGPTRTYAECKDASVRHHVPPPKPRNNLRVVSLVPILTASSIAWSNANEDKHGCDLMFPYEDGRCTLKITFIVKGVSCSPSEKDAQGDDVMICSYPAPKPPEDSLWVDHIDSEGRSYNAAGKDITEFSGGVPKQ